MYFAGTNKGNEVSINAITENLYTLEWTTDPPTEPGWYWIHFPSGAVECAKIDVINSNGIPIEFADRWALERVTHWLGPLPTPEPPK